MTNLNDLADSIASLKAVKEANAKVREALDISDAALDVSINRLTIQHNDILNTLNAIRGDSTQGVN